MWFEHKKGQAINHLICLPFLFNALIRAIRLNKRNRHKSMSLKRIACAEFERATCTGNLLKAIGIIGLKFRYTHTA